MTQAKWGIHARRCHALETHMYVTMVLSAMIPEHYLTQCKQIYHSFLFDPNYSHDVNELSVSLTSYANFVVKGFFSVTVVKEMQVLLTTHKSTNFYNLLFLLIPFILTKFISYPKCSLNIENKSLLL